MNNIKIYVSLCPYCFGASWPTAIDDAGEVLLLACHVCHYEAEPYNYLCDSFEFWDSWETEQKPRYPKMTIAGSVSNIWK